MKSFQTLPEGYAQIFRVDLQKNKKQAYLVNGAAVGITLVMFLLGRALVPFAVFFDISGGMKPFFIRVLALVAGTVGYVLLHELIHAIVMKLCGTEKVKLGFSGGYFYAGSRDYYPKAPYFCIALAPVVILGVICRQRTVVLGAVLYPDKQHIRRGGGYLRGASLCAHAGGYSHTRPRHIHAGIF